MLDPQTKRDEITNAGFTEAEADEFFAALVKLDQILGGSVGGYDNQGKLNRSHGDLFDSPLHFVGFGRGATVNSEIIQRLGVYYPEAGGSIGSSTRDLQMTTIDAPVSKQASGENSHVYDPPVKVWSNITFADNYYQTRDTRDFSTGTKLDNADWNVDLSDRVGFDQLEGDWGGHQRAMAWYLLTNNVNAYGVPRFELPGAGVVDKNSAYRRLGDLLSIKVEDGNRTWYTPDHLLATDGSGQPIRLGNADATWEGIGTGWFHSIAGGGYSLRPYKVNGQIVSRDKLPTDYFKTNRTSVFVENLASSDDTSLDSVLKKLRGDYAVPTVFNGNFDAISPNWDTTGSNQAIAGWSFGEKVEQRSLKKNIAGNSTFALELKNGDSITHNSLLVPDWGVLRFDLSTGDVPSSSSNQLKVTLRSLDGNALTREINLEEAKGTAGEYGNDLWRIGYGETGFETFTIDVPEYLRGKAATIEFKLEGGSPVYLDNIFFKSQHLLLGNPTSSRISTLPIPAQYQDNYLIEKPQYAASYSKERSIPNWVSWQLNESWLESEKTGRYFFRDPALPGLDWYGAKNEDYITTSNPDIRIPGTSFKFSPGHMAAFADRSRSKKDLVSTNVTVNIIPQHEKHNSPFWEGLESDFSRKLVQERKKELYIIAGGYGNAPYKPIVKAADGIHELAVPEYLWKVIAVLEPGQGVADISVNTQLIAVVSPNQEPAAGNDTTYARWYEPNGMQIISVRDLEGRLNADATNQRLGIHYDFFSHISQDIQDIIEKRGFTWTGRDPIDAFPLPIRSSLLADDLTNLTGDSTTIRHDSILKDSVLLQDLIPTFSETSVFNFGTINSVEQSGIAQASSAEISSPQNSIGQVSSGQISISEVSESQARSTQVSTSKIGSLQISLIQKSSFERSVTEINLNQTGFREISSTEVGITQIASFQIREIQSCPTKIDSLQISVDEFATNLYSPKISFPSGVSLQQFFSSHNFTLQNTTIPIWKEFLQEQAPFNLELEIADLPSGQLAEASVTDFDASGRPNAGTLTLDFNGNGLGWFIDSTPWENSEFAQSLTDSAFKATTASTAFGRYDLLTTILHEMGHLAGIIQGNLTFDRYVQTVSAERNSVGTANSKLFVGDGFTAALTPDGSHLDSRVHPYALMNSSLAPGVRKLPSQIDLQILNAIRNGITSTSQFALPTAPLQSTPLVGILNGSFDQSEAWDTRGDALILTNQAVLRENSRQLSNFTQTFVIPDGATALRFTIVDTDLDASTLAPGDAFEAALLDARSLQSLIAPSSELTQTDAFLNLQHTGQTYLGSKVTVFDGNTPNARIVRVDLKDIAPQTLATLSFDLLGFGTKDGSVTIDDVMLIMGNQSAPITASDTATTTQMESVVINVLNNDRDLDGTIDRTTLQVGTAPQNGTIAINPDGTVTYTPNRSFAGADQFTYRMKDNTGLISPETTVLVNVSNLAPQITEVVTDSTLTEGAIANFTATATDPGDDSLVYTWNFGDGSEPIEGRESAHRYAQNGTYTGTLTVSDPHGGRTTQSFTAQVQNVAPIVDAGLDRILQEGQAIQFAGRFTDAGILDTHTVRWDFGDGTSILNRLNPTHTYAQNGTYTTTLTVTDSDGAISQDTVTITVINTAPQIEQIRADTQVAEGQTARFNAIAVDLGNDTLTYIWNFGDGSDAVTGANATHVYAQNGSYTAILTVFDSDGAFTTQALTITVENVAPTVDAGFDQTLSEGQSIQLSGTFSDPGADTHTIEWNFGDGTEVAGSLTPTHIYSQNGTYTATLRITDSDGATTIDTVTITVTNVAPTITNISNERTVSEGQLTVFSATATDPGNDSLTYLWNFGDGSEAITGATVQHRYADNGEYNVTLTVRDSDGAETVQTLPFTVTNAAPVVDAGSDQTIDQGQTAQFNGQFTDAGILDTHQVIWNFGDGTQPVNQLAPTHLYRNNGIYTATLTVIDKDGAIVEKTVTITVNNVAPTIVELRGDRQTVEGQTVVFEAIATDPGNDALTYQWNFGDGSELKLGAASSHVYADNGVYTATLTVTDRDGAFTNQTFTVTVENAAAIVNAGVDQSAIEGSPITFAGTLNDAGILDTHTVQWDFGDGTILNGMLNPTHIYRDNGVYTATLNVIDKDGAISRDTVIVTVANANPTIVTLTGDTKITEGSVAQFSATAIDPGNDSLTYAWNFGDGSEPVMGANAAYRFKDNGIYTVTLTVRDEDGGITTETRTIEVLNAAPIVDAGTDQTRYLDEPARFAGQFTDAGILDTHTVTWDFGDGTTASGVLNPSYTYAIAGTYTATLTVIDKDGAVSRDTLVVAVKALPTIAISDRTMTEGDDGTLMATFTVSLSEISDRPVTVDFSTADGTAISGSDYTATNGKVTFASGQTTQTISVAVRGDQLDEFDETFFVNLSNVTNAQIIDAQAVGTIVDNDAPPSVTINDRTITEGDNGTQIVTFTVSLSEASAKPISVKYATVDGTAIAGSDYSATNGTLTFAPGQTTQTISVQVNGDRIDEFDETFVVNLTDATNATISDAQGLGTIVDNDAPPTIAISDRTITEGDNGTQVMTFTVNLSETSAKSISVNYATANGTAIAGRDYAATSGTLTFNPGQTSQTISVTVTNDRIDEFDETFFINLTNALNAEIADNQGLGTIVDNDAPPSVTVADTSLTEGQAGTKFMTFTLTLAAPSEKPVSVNYSTANGTAIAGQDYLATNGTAQFQPGQTTQTVNVQILGDQVVEANETLFLNLTGSTFAAIADNQAIGIILNDDAAPLLSVTASPAQLWPPNHRLVPIQVAIQTSDDSGIAPTVRILSVTSNEPINAKGDGNTAYDYEITADGRVFLRAERSGNGNGRIYTLTYQATDNAGNTTISTTTVRVPKNQGN